MVFKDKKVPKHLIIREEYEIRNRSRFGVFKYLALAMLIISIAWVVNIGFQQL